MQAVLDRNINFISAQDYSEFYPQIAKLEAMIFADDAWSALAIEQMLVQFGAGLCVALTVLADDRVQLMGYCIYQQVFEMVDIHRIATHPDFLRQQVASQLLTAVCERSKSQQAQHILLEVRADNVPAICFYHRFGFEQIDIRRGYYRCTGQAIDALILQKSL